MTERFGVRKEPRRTTGELRIALDQYLGSNVVEASLLKAQEYQLDPDAALAIIACRKGDLTGLEVDFLAIRDAQQVWGPDRVQKAIRYVVENELGLDIYQVTSLLTSDQFKFVGPEIDSVTVITRFNDELNAVAQRFPTRDRGEVVTIAIKNFNFYKQTMGEVPIQSEMEKLGARKVAAARAWGVESFEKLTVSVRKALRVQDIRLGDLDILRYTEALAEYKNAFTGKEIGGLVLEMHKARQVVEARFPPEQRKAAGEQKLISEAADLMYVGTWDSEIKTIIDSFELGGERILQELGSTTYMAAVHGDQAAIDQVIAAGGSNELVEKLKSGISDYYKDLDARYENIIKAAVIQAEMANTSGGINVGRILDESARRAAEVRFSERDADALSSALSEVGTLLKQLEADVVNRAIQPEVARRTLVQMKLAA